MSDLTLAYEHLQAARQILTPHHDVVDTDSPLVQRSNWAMLATDLIDEVVSLLPNPAINPPNPSSSPR